MEFSAQLIASFLKGEIEGNPDVSVSNIAKIEDAKPGTLAFLANPKYTPYIYTTQASIVLVNRTFKPEQPISATLIRVDDAYQAFASLLDLYLQQTTEIKTGIEQPCFIHQTAVYGNNVYIGAFSYIGKNVKIGDEVKIYPGVFIGDRVEIKSKTTIYAGVKIYHETIIGSNCTIHAGSVIGSDGFGFAPNSNTDYKKVPQIGNVILEDNVEIGANTTIDRATMGSTILRKGVKLDNLIQIAHNVEVGENTVMAALVGISGSTKIGKNCMFGGQVGIAGHLTIADDVKIGAQSGVPGNVRKQGSVLLGSPAIDIHECSKAAVVFKYLPEMRRKIAQLEREVDELKSKMI